MATQQMNKTKVTVRTIILVGVIVVIVGLIFGFKIFIGGKIKEGMAKQAGAPQTVSTMTAKLDDWQIQASAVGSTRAVHGVDITTELAGLVRDLKFKNGDEVKAGQVLVELNTDSDLATLHSLQANADLAKVVLNRDKQQLAAEAIAQAQVDNDVADLKSKEAQVASQQATIDKKIIRAPFSGKLGISTVNPGQYINPGDKIVTLQSIDPIYVDFTLPQQALASVQIGQTVTVTTDTYPGVNFPGKLTAIDPKIDTATRNVSLEATFPNPKRQLFPGMFGHVMVANGGPQRYITLPQTAITYNAYGSTVFIAQSTKASDGSDHLTAQQVFVTTGPVRGDQIAVLKGIKEGDQVVTTGQLKLFNGAAMVVDNSIPPANDQSPTPQEK
jgi:membrane fusion protein (multidrug efflux system)